VINHVYELPFGTRRRYLSKGFVSYLAGDWNLSGIWSVESGQRFTPTLAAAVSNSAGGGGDRPNRIADGTLAGGQQSIDRWFDVGAFTSPAQFQFGNSGRGILTGPNFFNLDLGIHRNFVLTERFNLSFRAEMFNAFNHPNFDVPNAVIGNQQAGQISSTFPARIMQMAMKVTF
jgi:hypothetical protein